MAPTMRGKLAIAGSTQVGGHDRFAVERCSDDTGGR